MSRPYLRLRNSYVRLVAKSNIVRCIIGVGARSRNVSMRELRPCSQRRPPCLVNGITLPRSRAVQEIRL